MPELWEFTGPHWILPIMVEPVQEVAIVTFPDIPFLPCQRMVLDNILIQIATGGVENERIVPMILLAEHAKKSDQSTAEEVVVWRRLPDRSFNLPKEEGVDEFIADWLVSSGLAISKAAAATIYVSLCTHMLHWLVNRRKPINLIFGVITPFQYRSNWKEILMGMCWLKAKQAESTFDKYIEKHVPTQADMVRSELVAWKDKICAWTFEFSASKWLNFHSNEVEHKRKTRIERLGNNYLLNVCRMMAANAERAIQTYKKYLHEERTKIVDLPEFAVDDRGYLGRLEKKSNRQSHPPYRAFVLPADTAQALEPRVAQNPPGTIGLLSKVPGVPCGDGPVRTTGETVGSERAE